MNGWLDAVRQDATGAVRIHPITRLLGGLLNTIRDRDIPMTIIIRPFMLHLLS